jgi:23S rRNA pseudouridine955/2504/2580 synthase
VFPVHRLDKDTAGILAVAKTSAAAGFWTREIAPHAIKEYAALCIGKPDAREGQLITPAGKKGGEKAALSEYRVEASSDTEPVFSFVHITLCTGRMHQIRMQLSDAHAPVAADDKYGDFALNREIKKIYGIKKLQLAAVKLTFFVDGEPLTLEIPLPEHMQAAHEAIFGRQ